MAKISIYYMDSKLKEIEIDKANKKEVKNAIDMVMQTIFTVISSNDAIFFDNKLISSPEELEEKLREKIASKKAIEITIKPYVMDMEETKALNRTEAFERVIAQNLNLIHRY